MSLDGAFTLFQHLDRGRPLQLEAALARGLQQGASAFNLPPESLALATEVANFAPGLDAPDRLALVALTLATLADVQRGCTRTPFTRAHLTPLFTDLLRPAGVVADTPAGVHAARLVERVPDLPGRAPAVLASHPDAYAPLLLLDGWLYQQRLLAAEIRTARRLRSRLGTPTFVVPELEAALTDIDRRAAAFQLSEEQLSAVRAACRQPLALVSGGPGTGKTSILLAMLRALVRVGVPPEAIALAAPTGKAADRMGRALGEQLARIEDPGPVDVALRESPPHPATLHRLLGYQPARDTWRHHPHHPLPAGAVVVDEASMVDLPLMERLAAAIRPDARLVLLGDADQLPSVAAGAVFRDLLSAAPAHCVRLTRSHRMRDDDPAGRAILEVARRVNAGDASVWDRLPGPGADLEVRGVQAANEDLSAFLGRWFRSRLRGDEALAHLRRRTWRPESEPTELDQLFAHFAATRLLCVTRGFATGAERVNARLHGLAAEDVGAPAAVPFLAGEPVMVLHNDYDRGLFNGDTGCVLWCADPAGVRRPMVVFQDGRAFPTDTLSGRLELAYATTVHKAQGSEFDEVALLLPEVDLPLLTRELLYTAITRSRRGVLVVGDPGIARRGTQRSVVRHSGLAERVR